MPKEDLPILNMDLPEHQKALRGYIKGLRGLIRFEFTQIRDQRSISQNAYMHGVIFPLIAMGLSKLWGYPVSMLDAKADMKDRFLRVPRFNPSTGEVTSWYTKSTADLDKEECGDFIDHMKEFAKEKLEIKIPEPNEYERKIA